jgi:hypothetical protein
VHSVGILEQSMGAGNRVRIGLSYRPARLHRLAKSIPWNRFLGPLTKTILLCIEPYGAKNTLLYTITQILNNTTNLEGFSHLYVTGINSEVEFLEEIQTEVLRVFLLAIHRHLY